MRLLKLVLAGVLSANSFYAFAEGDGLRITTNCRPELNGVSEISDRLREDPAVRRLRLDYAIALRDLKQQLPVLFPDIETEDYFQVLKRLLSAGLVKDGGMVLTAIIGPAGMGKSTLSNAIWALANESSDYDPGHLVSRPGRKSGLTVRPLIFAAKGDSRTRELTLRGLRARYGKLDPYRSPDDPTVPGPPLLVELDHLNAFPSQPFVDTPDMTTGDPQSDLAPVHQQTARNALLPAEVMLIMLNDENVRDFPLRDMLMNNFRKYGMRKSIFVLRTDAETDEEFAESREWLLETIRSIYGFKPNQRKELEEAVLGIYAMQNKRAVRLGQAHPKLIPFDGSDHFATLMLDMANNAGEIRAFAGNKAAALLYGKVGGKVDDMDAQLRVKRIYDKAIKAVLEVSPTAVDFPYEQARDQWRDLFSAQTPKSTRYLDRTAALASKALKVIPQMNLSELPLADVLKTFDSSLRAAWTNRLNAILTDLKKNQIRLPVAVADELIEMIAEFSKLHPEHTPNPTVLLDTATQLKTINLPSAELLSLEDKKSLNAVTSQTSEDVLRRMTETPAEKAVQLVDVDEVVKGLRVVLDTGYENGGKARDIGLDVLTVGAPLTLIVKIGFVVAASTVTAGGAAVAGFGALATSAASGFVRKWREGRTDGDLKPKLDAWFKKDQVDEFKKRLDGFLLQDLRQHLSSGISGPETQALEKVRRALGTLLTKSKEDPATDSTGNLGIRSTTGARINVRGTRD